MVPGSDADRFVETDRVVWFGEPLTRPAEERLIGLPAGERFAAEVDDVDPATYAGVYGVFPMTLAVPGEVQVPCAGLTWVGVHPDHRRRGVLTTMMRHHLERVHADEHTHVSALHASEPAIYGRYGYGLGSLELEVKLGRRTTLTAPHLDDAANATETRMVAISDPDVPKRMRECHLASARTGTVVGELGFYNRVCHEFPEQLRDKEGTQVLFARRDGVDVGFTLFRRSHDWERARPSGELSAWGLVGDAAARLALLRRLVDFDLMGSVKVTGVGPDDPLLLWAGGPRATSDVATYDSLWVRVVDIGEALQARTWSAPCDVVVHVDDRFGPWNDGTWRIHVDDSGEAQVEPSNADAVVRLPIEALGAAYLGGGNLVALQSAGLIDEQRPGAVAELWRAMRTDLLPAAAWMF